MKVDKLIMKYSKFVVHHPILLIIITLVITFIGATFYDNLGVKNPSVDEILPSDLPVVQGIKKLSDDLGGDQSTAFMVVIELEPEGLGSINDIRDPEIVKYSHIIEKQILEVNEITGTSGIGSITYDINNNVYPNSVTDVRSVIDNNQFAYSRIVNEKYTMALIRVYAIQDFDVEYLVEEVQKIIDNTPKPVGINVQLAGESIANKISEDLTGPDSQKTTNISLLAIVVILLITFRTIVYGLLPLFTILFGVLWTFAFMGIAGIKMSGFTAGAISMIVGIGIDFGIQTIMRYRQELASANPVLAMEHTLENVLKPMFITTVAAFIGFWSMTFGDFMVIGELGKIMALGVVFCFFAAATVVPAICVIYEKYKPKKKFNTPLKILKRFVLLIRGKAKY